MEHSEGGSEEPTSPASAERTLEVLFEIELSDRCSCLASNSDAKVKDVHSQICDDVCHAEVTVTDESETDRVVHATNRIGDECLCLTFSELGCVPRIKSADDDSILIETYLEDRSVITELVARLDAVADTVSLRRLTSRDATGPVGSNPTTIDLSRLTTKQRDAAMLAVSRGYYETPRQVTLDELADILGISKSALSQRLTVVESKLAKAAFDP